MKFGQKINNALYAEWRPFYLDYAILKRELKDRTTVHEWNDNDEAAFTRMLEKELDKIHDFQKAKTAELSRRIRDAERDVQQLVEREQSRGSVDNNGTANGNSSHAGPHDAEAHPNGDPERIQDAGSDDDDTDGEGSDSDEHRHAGRGRSSSDAQSDSEEAFLALEDEVATLVADVHDLALFSKLNITGFMKILKKHDKVTGRALKASFARDYLERRPFYKYSWDALIVKLSRTYDLVRTRGHPVAGDSAAGGAQSAFVRQTTKYWVHPDNLVHLKLAILRHLPVLVFDSSKEFTPSDAAITSIYFDNPELELYLGRLEKSEGAEAIRLRWYGDTDVQTIFVERKTHREDWTGEKSVKARFPLKAPDVDAFLRGEKTLDEDFQALVTKGKKTQQEVDSMLQLANEVQYAVLTRNLRPVMRTFYNRTAFQLPGDARVRISLDTELTMVREDSFDGQPRAGNHWRREDIGIDFPFSQLPPGDVERFPYGVLEVKLQTQLGQEPPTWVTDLVQSHLVEAVPKFSKFIHGCATLLPERVDLVPFWLPQMETDIRKPDTGALALARPTSTFHTRMNSRSGSSGSPVTAAQTPRSPASGESPTSDEPKHRYTEPLSEGEEDEERDRVAVFDEDIHVRAGLSEHGEAVRAAIAYREKNAQREKKGKTPAAASESGTGSKAVDYAAAAKRGLAKDNGENNGSDAEDDNDDTEEVDERMPFLRSRQARKSNESNKKPANPRALSIDPLAPSSAFDQTLRDRLAKQVRDREGANNGDDESESALDDSAAPSMIATRAWRAPPGKRIAVPVRIEPKVFFALERTFLRWLNFAVLISTIATALLNFTPTTDEKGLVAAGMFTFCALLAIAYAAGAFVYRARRLRKRRASGLYHDRWGPTVLCVVLLGALGANIGMRVVEIW